MGVVVVMRLFAVLVLLVLLAVIVAVGERVVVVLVRVPVSAMLPFAEHAATMVMSYVVVIMGVRCRRMSVCRRTPLALRALRPWAGRRRPGRIDHCPARGHRSRCLGLVGRWRLLGSQWLVGAQWCRLHG